MRHHQWMITIRSGFTLKTVADYLQAASSKALDVSNEQEIQGKVISYLRWASDQRRTLGSAISNDDMNRLITTPTYWAVLNASTGQNQAAVLDVLRRELEDQRTQLDAEAKFINGEIAKIAGRPSSIAVLDTNVLMMDHARLLELPWHAITETRDMHTVRVVIPIVVVDELDKLKRSGGDMQIGDKRIPRRTIARHALRRLNDMFNAPGSIYAIDQSSDQLIRRPVTFELLLDDPGHERIQLADAEIRDRTLALVPYANGTMLVTYDLGNKFSAEAAGLKAIRLDDPEDRATDEDPAKSTSTTA